MGDVYERLPCDIKQIINKFFWDDIHVLSRRLLILMRNKVMRINKITEKATLGFIGIGLENIENIIKIEVIECINISDVVFKLQIRDDHMIRCLSRYQDAIYQTLERYAGETGSREHFNFDAYDRILSNIVNTSSTNTPIENTIPNIIRYNSSLVC